MKKYLLICVLEFSSKIYSQVKTAVFKDGTKVDYIILSNELKSSNKLSAWITPGFWSTQTNTETLYLLGASYFQSDRFYISTLFDPFYTHTAYYVDGLIFFKSWNSKPIYKWLPITNGVQKTYIVKEPRIRRSSLGIHLGYENVEDDIYYYSKSIGYGYNGVPDIYYDVAKEIYIGVGTFMGKFIKFTYLAPTQNKKLLRRRRTELALFMDYILYSRKYNPVGFNPTNITGNSNFQSSGFRVYMQGKLSFGYAKENGLTYSLGYGNVNRTWFGIIGIGYYGSWF